MKRNVNDSKKNKKKLDLNLSLTSDIKMLYRDT